jgi:peptide/nickel transport system substrate-binding protein
LPIQDKQFSRNFARYNNAEAWALTQQLSKTSATDPKYKEIIGQLQKIALDEMPIIPLWYNGLWSQVNDSVWTNWPSSAPGTPKALPTTWNDLWEMGSIKFLCELKPAGK